MIWTKDQYTLSDKVEDQDAAQIYALLDAKYLDKIICPDVACFMMHVSSIYLSTICMTALCGMILALFFYNLEREICIMKRAGKKNFVCTLTEDAHTFYNKLGFKQRPVLMSTDVSYL